MPKTTRTINPLHFEDLEPHRFEDLIRQLTYDFRDWAQLEATGRAGSDDGFDARAIERVYAINDSVDEEDVEERSTDPTEERIWLVQCKREKTISPAKIKKYAEDITVNNHNLYGVILAAPCTLSLKARDAFRNMLRSKGIQEIHMWGKAELEDVLFQPRNDHLLFAYFGISLAIRRKTLRTQIRSRLSMKRKAVRILGGVGDDSYREVLIRDASDTAYPNKSDVKDFDENPKWLYRTFIGHHHNGLRILTRSSFAYVADDMKHWDAYEDVNDAQIHNDRWADDDEDGKDEERSRIWQIWDKIPEKKNKAWYKCVGLITYDAIIDIDEYGDGFAECPHIYVPFEGESGPFAGFSFYVEVTSNGYHTERLYFPKDEDRIDYFKQRLSLTPETTGGAS